MHTVIHQLKQDYPEVAGIIDPYFRDVDIPSQAPSSVDVRSEMSQGSQSRKSGMTDK